MGPISENITDAELGLFSLNPVIEKTMEVTEQTPIMPGIITPTIYYLTNNCYSNDYSLLSSNLLCS